MCAKTHEQMETSSGDNRATQGMYFQGTTIYICTPPILTKLDTTRLGSLLNGHDFVGTLPAIPQYNNPL
ncbi:uncharacterized protein G2W53_045159 [Senna tora]|uniref:Uncharacterized protein n=1 Tax=Senna tora TaxID=362788 RepID=A0A834VY44_9FABA|nr:uncharacterized protein G2W53_044979 [Senna tora]KAF7801115.1 uncharacterized protein G2W53_045159 [Senna tora]